MKKIKNLFEFIIDWTIGLTLLVCATIIYSLIDLFSQSKTIINEQSTSDEE